MFFTELLVAFGFHFGIQFEPIKAIFQIVLQLNFIEPLVVNFAQTYLHGNQSTLLLVLAMVCRHLFAIVSFHLNI